MNIELSEGMPLITKLRDGTEVQLLKQFQVDNKSQIGIYQGTLSEFDMLLRYREYNGNIWSRVRTPKHLHWAVDVITKQNLEPELTKEFIQLLLDYWPKVKPLTTKEEREAFLSGTNLVKEVELESQKFNQLEGIGAYSVKFLLLMAKILMYQEKTNYHQAYMFKQLLEKLLDGNDLFSILSIASHR